METLLILRFARVRKLRFHRNHKSEITRADTWLLTQNMSSNTYVHMKFESVLSAPIRTVHSRTCRRACPCQKNLHENRASHIEVLTRSPRFLYTKWSSKNDGSLLFQSNEEDLLWKWEYANLLTFPRAWLLTALLCTFIHKYILRLSIFRGFPKCWKNRKGDLVDGRSI